MTLLEEFKNKSEKGAVVLLATHSFWQGVYAVAHCVVFDRSFATSLPLILFNERKHNGYNAKTDRHLMTWLCRRHW